MTTNKGHHQSTQGCVVGATRGTDREENSVQAVNTPLTPLAQIRSLIAQVVVAPPAFKVRLLRVGMSYIFTNQASISAQFT
jgi:hypothetical protein